LCEPKTPRREPVDIRRVDIPAIAARIGEPHVVREYQQKIRLAWSRTEKRSGSNLQKSAAFHPERSISKQPVKKSGAMVYEPRPSASASVKNPGTLS
jgi:hypothetical protein